MDISPQSHRQTFGTHIVPRRFDEEELTRLPIQDRFITEGMGGVLPELPDPTIFKRVLDVGCSVGAWLIQTAQTYPSISRLIGIDINPRMIAYASKQAEQQGIGDRVEFRVMDALRVLEFPDKAFDLVNMRMGATFIRTWDWPRLLQEFQHVARPGGVIRLVESDMIGSSTSAAFNRMSNLLVQALYQAGYLFTPNHNSLLNETPHLMKQQGIREIHMHTHTLEFRGGTPAGQTFAEDVMRAIPVFEPFLQKWLRLPEDFEDLTRQMAEDMQQPDFLATWTLLTAWGNKALR